jgi:Pyruvate/2-oxoacid:ferredoxin oxidoreductase delta subunit
MPGTEFDREATYTILGVEQFCQERGIRILRIDPEGNEQDWVPVQPAGAKKLRRFHVPRILNEACLINLPVLKTHVVSTMTLGMKNPMGILPRPDRRSMHTFGIDQSIVDMNLGIKPDLTIIDGSVGQDGEGPLYGDRADLQVLVAGHDSLAVDLVCCQLVGVKPRDIPHLKLALEQVGKPSWTLAGEDVGVIKQFRLPEVKPLYRFVFWMMYPLDYPFTWISERGKHLCTTLYSTGLVGTRPQIKEENCTRCGVCVEACPLPNVIDLKSLKVNYATCQRCLLCYEACPENAISVKGYSGARQ